MLVVDPEPIHDSDQDDMVTKDNWIKIVLLNTVVTLYNHSNTLVFLTSIYFRYLILQDTWLPPPVILCDHVDSIEKVLPEFVQIVRLWKTTRNPRYDDFLHVTVRVSVGSDKKETKGS